MDTTKVDYSLALRQACVELAGVEIRLSPPGDPRAWFVAHCCQTIYISPDQPLADMIDAAIAGARALRRYDQLHHDVPRLLTYNVNDLLARRQRHLRSS